MTLAQEIRNFREKRVLEAVVECKGNQCEAARRLGTHRNLVNAVVRKCGLSSKEVKRFSGVVK